MRAGMLTPTFRCVGSAAPKAADFAAKHEAAAVESKGAAEQRRSDADAARQEVRKLETAAKKAKLDAANSAVAVKEANNRAAKLDPPCQKTEVEGEESQIEYQEL